MWTYSIRRYLSTQCHVRVRFAPSPTGILHLGGLRTALYNYLFAKSHDGKFLLRIEDTDQVRLVPGAMEKLTDILSWVGIQVDEGPVDGGRYAPYVQSLRLNHYQQYIKKLEESGMVYKCFCTTKRLELLRKEAGRRGEVPKYDNKCRHISDSDVANKLKDRIPYVLRFKLEPYEEAWQDLVYGPIHQNIAEVEGDPEWQASTTKHILLYKAFGWTPPQFGHLPLILNRDGSKLSKRQNDIHVEHFRERGYFPESVLNLITYIGGGFDVRETSGMTIEELVKHFSLEKVRTQSTRLEVARINEFNRIHLTTKLQNIGDRQQLVDRLHSLLITSKTLTSGDDLLSQEYLHCVLDWSLLRIHLLEDLLKSEFRFVWHSPSFDSKAVVSSESKDNLNSALRMTISALQDLNNSFTQTNIGAALKQIPKQHKLKVGDYMKLLRTVISGLKQGPGVAEMIALLGCSRSVHRLETAVNHIERTSHAENSPESM
ncbi:nondiscriminating glutamyl-tRNA synthetase EARS2, mitochondrial-like isoform X2 [Tubulanus polymorphus]|uniref:nondiscriminating glutamyl-tRNA synthetase EARS2, mitochondrial-like isoform X2 n=1 Tax=Tubulanus polymorphus TaxID=672921 RepID=UPI003DA2CA75